MVYVPELDRQGFADRQSKNRRPRPSINYTKRDDVREMMRSPMGKNYGNMMDLQSQAARQGGFDKGDPKIAELKAARRQYNRKDKYKIGELMGYEPLDVQDTYRRNSEVLREHARPTYKTMYPVTDIAREISGSGGLSGMLLNKAFGKSKKAGKNFFDDLRGMGADIFGSIGIGGAVPRDEATEKVLTNYADKTFGDAYPTNIHDDEFIDTENWYDDRKDIVIPPDYPIDEGAFTSLHPFDDSRREEAIMAQYPGRKDVPIPKRPNMYDVAGPWFGTAPLEDVTISDLPEEGNLISDELWDSIRDFDLSTLGGPDIHAGEDITVAPWLTDPSLPMPEELIEGEKYLPGNYYDELIEDPPSIPFDDSFREAGIADAMKSGLNLAGRRPYEDEYRSFVESSGPVMVTYEDFIETYLPRIQESRGVFRAGLNSQGRR